MNSIIEQSTVDIFSIEMVQHIINNETDHIPGSASGVILPGDKSKIFTPITQKKSSLIIAFSYNRVITKRIHYNKEKVKRVQLWI